MRNIENIFGENTIANSESNKSNKSMKYVIWKMSDQLINRRGKRYMFEDHTYTLELFRDYDDASNKQLWKTYYNIFIIV